LSSANDPAQFNGCAVWRNRFASDPDTKGLAVADNDILRTRRRERTSALMSATIPADASFQARRRKSVAAKRVIVDCSGMSRAFFLCLTLAACAAPAADAAERWCRRRGVDIH